MRVPRLTEEDVARQLEKLLGWTRDGAEITRTYGFAGFRQAVAFVGQVAEAAEDADHHPDMDIRYKKVTLRLTTHDCGGLTRLDFALAAICDRLAEGSTR